MTFINERMCRMDHRTNNPDGWKKRFYTITAGQTVSIIGSSAVQFALIWWLARETASPMMMSLAGLAAFLPQMLLGPFAGVWIDRLKRKTVIICADLFLGMVAALFALSFLWGTPPVWSVCVVLGLRAMGNVFHTPAIQAVVPMLVPGDQLVKANGVSQFLQAGAYMLGPVIGAALYAAFPMPVLLLTDLLGALVASITVAVVKIPEIQHQKQGKPQIFKEMKEGLALFSQDKRFGFFTLACALCMVFFMPLSSMYPLLSSDYFRVTEWHAGVVQIIYSVGMMAGAVVIGQIKIQNKIFAAGVGTVILGVTAFLCGILPQNMTGFWLFAAICLVMGASMNIYNVPYMAYMQESFPREALGRATALVGTLMSFAMPVGLLVAGPVAERYGLTLWFVISGIAIVGIMVLTGIVSRVRFQTE